MTERIQPISEIDRRAKDALIREVGVVDTTRSLNQFRAGSGDYTVERESLFKGMTAKGITAEIKSRQTGGARGIAVAHCRSAMAPCPGRGSQILPFPPALDGRCNRQGLTPHI
jgi:hypothetical protein